MVQHASCVLLLLSAAVVIGNPIDVTIGDLQYSYYDADPESGERLSWIEAQHFCERLAPSLGSNLATFNSREQMRLLVAELTGVDPTSKPWVAYRIDDSFVRLVMDPNNVASNQTFSSALASPTLPFQQPGTCGALNIEPGDDALYAGLGVVQANCKSVSGWICQQPYQPCAGNPILNRLTHRCRLSSVEYHTCLGSSLFLSSSCPPDHICVDCGEFVRASNDSFSTTASVCYLPELAPKC
ncbi:hypothetical protein PBRA_009331 [Plasmodiophora brassicae]|nr:secrectory protein [Plasmodiophora brassicae]CEP03113.1 hypothetical protein PBRA_009331 [Plasmodiophora brassicae]